MFREVWLPKGFEWLSGYPEWKRRKCRLAMIQVNVDETGIDGRSPWLVFSALMATAEDWARASDAWQEVLDESPRIRYFKANDAARLQREFYAFSKQDRDHKLMRLAGCLQGVYPFLELTLVCDLEAVTGELSRRLVPWKRNH